MGIFSGSHERKFLNALFENLHEILRICQAKFSPQEKQIEKRIFFVIICSPEALMMKRSNLCNARKHYQLQNNTTKLQNSKKKVEIRMED